MEFYNNKLKEIRKSKKITIQELANKIGFNRLTLNAWETGKRTPSESKIQMLAKALDISVDQISDLEPISKIEFSGPAKSWLELSENGLTNKKNSEFNALITGIELLRKKFTDIEIIINALKVSTFSMFYVKDTNLKYITSNQAFLKNLSLNINYNILNKVDSDLFSSNEARINTEQDKEALLSGKTFQEEGFIPGSRKKKWGIITKTPIKDNDGKIQGVTSSFIDITDRKRNEIKREILEANINLISECLFIQDEYGNDIYSNKACEEVYGYPLESFKTKHFWFEKCLHNDYRSDWKTYSAKKKYPKTCKLKIIRSDCKIRWIERISHQTKIFDKQFFFFIDKDITEDEETKNKLKKIKSFISNKDKLSKSEVEKLKQICDK